MTSFSPEFFFCWLSFLRCPTASQSLSKKIYDDDDGEGFKDETALTQTQKDFLAMRGNDAETLGEARKNALEHVTSLLESRLTNTNTIRISAKFVFFSGQEDPNNPGECLANLGTATTIATGAPTGHGYPSDRLDEGDTNANRMGLGTAYPYALYEAISGEGLNQQDADIRIKFSKCYSFYYGLTGSAPTDEVDFVWVSLHEIMHGIGFYKHVLISGTFLIQTITIHGESDGTPTNRRVTIRSRTIYDEQLYSDADDDLLINLSSGQRAAAITSGAGLLWEGTDNGRNSCSYGQRMGELKSSSAKAQDGNPSSTPPRLMGPDPLSILIQARMM